MIQEKAPSEPVEKVLVNFCSRHAVSMETCKKYYDRMVKTARLEKSKSKCPQHHLNCLFALTCQSSIGAEQFKSQISYWIVWHEYGRLIFVGLGLNDEKGISLRGLEATRTADSVFIELYTSLLPDFSLQRLEDLVSKKNYFGFKTNLEEENGVSVIMAARQGKAVLWFLATLLWQRLMLRANWGWKEGDQNAHNYAGFHNQRHYRVIRVAQLQVWKDCHGAFPRKFFWDPIQCYRAEQEIGAPYIMPPGFEGWGTTFPNCERRAW